MWETKDGFLLTMPRSTLEAFASEAEAEHEGECSSCVRAAVLNEVERMVKSARRSGSMRSKRTGRKLNKFSGKSGGRSFSMVTKPAGPARNGAGPARNAIVGMRPWPWGPGWGSAWGPGPAPGCVGDDCTASADDGDGDDDDDMLEG
jgi:hypothetical protein